MFQINGEFWSPTGKVSHTIVLGKPFDALCQAEDATCNYVQQYLMYLNKKRNTAPVYDSDGNIITYDYPFRADYDGDHFCIIRFWDGDDYRIVCIYDVIEVPDKILSMTKKEENIANIAMIAATLLKDNKIETDEVNGHVGLCQEIVSLADQFEDTYTKMQANGEPDYFESIDNFAEQQLLMRFGKKAEPAPAITLEMVRNAFEVGLIRLILSPNGDGIACKIGELWFYFGGTTAEEYDSVAAFLQDIPTEDIVSDIFTVLEAFRQDGESGEVEFAEEYAYYCCYLQENGIVPGPTKWIHIYYSWGDEESPILVPDGTDAWEYAKNLAVREAEVSSVEGPHPEIGMRFIPSENTITLHYYGSNIGFGKDYDSWSYYVITDSPDFEPPEENIFKD